MRPYSSDSYTDSRSIREVFRKYRHGIPVVVYMVIYFLWWSLLERKVTSDYRVIHMRIDDVIPFCELFVIPYFLWFAYVSLTVLYLFFQDTAKTDYYRCLVFLFTGMTVFLIVSTVMPNGHQLRPAILPRDNIFTRMIMGLWRTDTPTNIWPSIHVYNSIGAHLAICKSEITKNKRGLNIASLILSVSIILSTMFIKQHSAFDVITAFVMAAIMYYLVYHKDITAEISEHFSREKSLSD